MNYVSVSGIIQDVVNRTNDAILPQLKKYGEFEKIQYEQGHFLEISKVLKEKSESSTGIYQKWPLICLFRDFREGVGEQGIYSAPKLTIMIAHRTEEHYTSDERESKVFKPVLYPIYFEFMQQLRNDARILLGETDELRATKIDHYFWGSQTVYDKGPNIFNEWTDSIEITDVDFKIDYNNC